jgi:PAS domain S-box-containing protein
MQKPTPLLALALLVLASVIAEAALAANSVFDASSYFPHGVCYSWNPTLIGLHVASDSLIGLAYFSIPPALLYFARRRADLPFPWIFILFGLFIVACGATHWMEVWTLWRPEYWLSGIIKAITAAASVPTAIALVWLIPRALVIPSAEQLRLANERLEREVRERERVEAALRESHAQLEQRVAERTRELSAAYDTANRHREWLQTTLASIGDAVIVTDHGGIVLFMNAVAEHATGWQQGEAHELPLRDVFRIVNEETREAAPDPVQRTLSEGAIVGLANHTVLIRRDGHEIPIDDSAAPIRDRTGQVSGAVLVFRDVTEHRRAEEERREALATLENFVTSAPFGIAILDRDMRYLVVNDTLAAMNGIPPAEHVGKSVGEIVPDLQSLAETTFAKVWHTGAPLLNQEFSGEDPIRPGETGWWEESWFAILGPDGKTRRVAVIVNDITERRRVQEALRRERELLQRIIDTIPVMITQYRPDTQVVSLNREFERRIGWTSTEAAGISLMEACYPDPSVRECAREFMESAHDGWLDVPMRTRNGADIQTSWANIRLSDDTRIGIGIDITDRKRHEEELKEDDRRKDAFLATLSHELRNPMAPIQNSIAILKARGGHNDPDTEWASNVLERQVAHMSRLLDDLLDMSRITQNRLELRQQEVEIHSVIEAAVETSRPAIDGGHHRLRLLPAPHPVRLQVDPVRLAQIFTNLLNNAAKYTDDGGEITVSVTSAVSEVIVSVKDNGIGLTRENLATVFEMFSQASLSRGRSRGGLGIGLSLARALVRLHGGTIQARSDGPGKGSEFIVTLPLTRSGHAAPASEVQLAQSPAAASRRAKRIVVVDDNQDAADSLTALLRIKGHQVEVAYDGESAIALVMRALPDLVLLDIGLPGKSGYQVAREIRDHTSGRTVLVALTGWGKDEDKRRALESGFDQHFTKPLTVDQLEDILDRLVAPNTDY